MTWPIQISRPEAVAFATTVDVIVATPAMFPAFAADMKAANPSLRMLVYLNGMFSLHDDG